MRWDNTTVCIHALVHVFEKEKKIGFNGGIGAWVWSVSGEKRASEWGGESTWC